MGVSVWSYEIERNREARDCPWFMAHLPDPNGTFRFKWKARDVHSYAVLVQVWACIVFISTQLFSKPSDQSLVLCVISFQGTNSHSG